MSETLKILQSEMRALNDSAEGWMKAAKAAEKRLAEATDLLERCPSPQTPEWRESSRAFLSATTSPPAEPALREVAGELEKAKAKIGRIVDGGIVLSRAGIELEKRLAEATALLERARRYIGHNPNGAGERLCKDILAHLSATTTPAPSLVEQIEAIVKAFEERKPLPAMSNVATATLALSHCLDTIEAIRDLLRAAREAGGR